jgi:non-specific serine/threonine protein kinase
MGIIFYEMLTGHIPYDGDSAVTIALQHFQKPLPSVIAENPSVPQALENVVIKATAKKLSDRYQSVSEMYVDLSTSLSYNRRNEPKLVFDDANKADTKTLPKVSQSTLTSIPKTQVQEERPSVRKPTQEISNQASVQKPAKKRKFKARYMIILASLLLVAASLIWIFSKTPATIAIPDVAGQTVAEAKETLKKSNFEVGEEKSEASETVAEGRVIRTDPEAGSGRKEGSKVNLIVSSGKQSFQLSNYVGRKSSDVIAELKEKKVPENLIKIEEEESSEGEEGTVLRQTPAAGSTYDLTKATSIVLTVAKKVTSVSMPSYIGSSLEFTKNNLIQIVGVKEANIEIVEVSTAPEGTTAGIVVSQDPKPGEKVDLNKTRIKISIYKPKPAPSSSSSSSSSQRENQGTDTTPTQGNHQGNNPSTNPSSGERTQVPTQD